MQIFRLFCLNFLSFFGWNFSRDISRFLRSSFYQEFFSRDRINFACANLYCKIFLNFFSKKVKIWIIDQ
jgi:hypothetical protein